jgi:hypothetical protein
MDTQFIQAESNAPSPTHTHTNTNTKMYTRASRATHALGEKVVGVEVDKLVVEVLEDKDAEQRHIRAERDRERARDTHVLCPVRRGWLQERAMLAEKERERATHTSTTPTAPPRRRRPARAAPAQARR